MVLTVVAIEDEEEAGWGCGREVGGNVADLYVRKASPSLLEIEVERSGATVVAAAARGSGGKEDDAVEGDFEFAIPAPEAERSRRGASFERPGVPFVPVAEN